MPFAARLALSLALLSLIGCGGSGGDSAPPAMVTLSMDPNLSSAHVQISPQWGPHQYPVGTIVHLTAIPQSGYAVMGWSGTDDDSSTSTQNNVTMTGDRSASVIVSEVISN